MARLTEEALEFARAHIANFYDSDFYPKPFEYEAVWHNWAEVKEYILSKDINDIQIETPRTFCSLKPSGSFRIVHQLDPITSILYTAISYIVAEPIERLRPAKDKRIACSYRVNINKNKGILFTYDSSYTNYIDKCVELSTAYQFALVTDIVDFYNQIYIHRVENAISVVEDDYARSLSKPLEDLLMSISSGSSKGIPVGPAASIILAEAIMIDIDEYITSKGLEHTRYVDDIRIFSNSKNELISFLDQLTLYLHEGHRLTLSSQKTKILSSGEFTQKFLESPELTEKCHVHDKLKSIIRLNDAYDSPIADEPSENVLRPSILAEMLATLIKSGTLDLGIARHVLKKAREYRIRSIIGILLENFDFFAPVIPHVVLYLRKVTNIKVAENIKKRIEEILENSSTAKLEFIKLWLSEYLCDYTALIASPIISKYISSSKNYSAQSRSLNGQRAITAFRTKKATVCHMNDWEKRAFLLQTRSIPREEARAYLTTSATKCQDNITSCSVIKWLRSLR